MANRGRYRRFSLETDEEKAEFARAEQTRKKKLEAIKQEKE